MYSLGTVDNRNSYVTATIADGSQSVSIPQANAILESLTRNQSTLSSLIAESIPYVMREYPAFIAARSTDSVAYARHCVVMALLSPQLTFRQNLELAQNVAAEFTTLDTLADVHRVMFITTRDGRRARFNGWINKAETLYRALPYLRTIRNAADVTRDSLIALHGIGPKVAAFALHLIDWNAPVFTLDVHMLRLFSQLAGLPIAANMQITPAAYRVLESGLVEYVRAAFPQYPVFAVQWSLWNCVLGYHVNHENLFA